MASHGDEGIIIAERRPHGERSGSGTRSGRGPGLRRQSPSP